ncbi:hypothetical protein C1H46_019596 [Malus baccata]|uniref:Uncharacterized protein n=1 Tax=Malus baccata TaxID=106549 RepID=A0A540M7S1_MALBA|nr:hypothetical protein C1H46_019596 [Malus baccata]
MGSEAPQSREELSRRIRTTRLRIEKNSHYHDSLLSLPRPGSTIDFSSDTFGGHTQATAALRAADAPPVQLALAFSDEANSGRFLGDPSRARFELVLPSRFDLNLCWNRRYLSSRC